MVHILLAILAGIPTRDRPLRMSRMQHALDHLATIAAFNNMYIFLQSNNLQPISWLALIGYIRGY